MIFNVFFYKLNQRSDDTLLLAHVSCCVNLLLITAQDEYGDQIEYQIDPHVDIKLD